MEHAGDEQPLFTRLFIRVFDFRVADRLESDWQVAAWHTLRVMAGVYVRVKEKPEASIFNRTSTTSGNSLYWYRTLFERFHRDLSREYNVCTLARELLVPSNQIHWSGRLSRAQINTITSPDNLIKPSIYFLPPRDARSLFLSLFLSRHWLKNAKAWYKVKIYYIIQLNKHGKKSC